MQNENEMIGKMKTPETDALYERLLAENPGNLIYLEEMLELACRLERERDEAVDMIGKLTQHGVELMNEHISLQRERRGLVDKLKKAVEIGSDQAAQFDRLMVAMGAEELTIYETIALWNDTRKERDEAIFSKNTSAADFLKQIRQITLCKDVAREKLLMAEKERDETRKQFVDFLNKTEDYKRERDEALMDRNDGDIATMTRNHYERLIKERDEAKADAAALADKLSGLELRSTEELARLEQERDEAREALRELWQTADAYIPQIDEEQTTKWHNAMFGNSKNG